MCVLRKLHFVICMSIILFNEVFFFFLNQKIITLNLIFNVQENGFLIFFTLSLFNDCVRQNIF